MVVQAAAGKRVVGDYPVAGAEAAAEIQRSGRGALIEMRRLFGMLHGEDGLSELAATPRMSDLEALLQRYRAAGLVVELDVRGEATPLSAGADAVAYRVVEEALDNVLAHAGPTRVRVQIGHSSRELTIDVADDGPTATARSAAGRGPGLLGMHERVTLYGGTLETGPRGGGGYAVHARLPRQAVKC
jgi:signal transduction histidine kinase